jgi:hypothetical protein
VKLADLAKAFARPSGEASRPDRSVYPALALALAVALVLFGLLVVPSAPQLTFPAQPTAFPTLPDEPAVPAAKNE